MTINVSGQREQVVLSLVRAGKFTSADEVIDEALRLMEQRYQGQESATAAVSGEASASLERTRQQLENLRRLGQKLDTMPVSVVADGLSNRDHDRLLYTK